MRALYFILVLFSIVAHAQTPAFELKGKFKLQAAGKRPVNFQLTWSEDDGRVINGKYQDDFFISEGAIVTGAAQPLGRDFLVRFPTTIKGVRTISMLSSQYRPGDTPKALALTIITRDPKGDALEINDIYARIAPQRTKEASMVAQKEEEGPRPEEPCVEHFGVLAGFCGSYKGLMTEELDHGNQCTFGSAEVRLALLDSGSLVLYLPDQEGVGAFPRHELGRIAAGPEDRNIDVMNRHCGPLPGTKFKNDCKRLNLQGSFTAGTGAQHFTGTYTITEEATGALCKYGLSLGKE